MSKRRLALRPDYRRAAIWDLIESRGEVSVEALAEKFDASLETIRRDLGALADAGRVRKVHGGAVRVSPHKESVFGERTKHNALAKQIIARKLVGVVSPGQTLFMDTGTTTLACAQTLADVPGLTVITNSFRIADAITSKGSSSNVIAVGGNYRHDNAQTVGAATVAEIGHFRADLAVLTIGALDDRGAYDFSAEEAQVARAMRENADQLCVVADLSKLNKHSTYKVCDHQDIDKMILDDAPGDALSDVLRAADVEVL